MTLRGRVNAIKHQIKEMRPGEGRLVPVRTGVWRCDESGKIIPNSGKTIFVRESEVGRYGILLFYKHAAKDEWIKEAKEHQAKMMQRANEKIVEGRKSLAAVEAGPSCWPPMPACPKPEASPEAPVRKVSGMLERSSSMPRASR